MLFSIAMALMVILVAGFWTYQGFYSSALMFFECVIAALVAFGFYESLHGVLGPLVGEALGRGLSFLVLFLVPLALLRVMTDRLFPDNVKLPVAVDRAGAAVFGLLAGLLLIGTPLVGIQMLPIGSTVFGYERVTVGADGGYRQSGLLLAPDSFAVGMANLASGGGFSGANSLPRSRPNLLLDLYGARNCVQTEDRHDAPPDSLKVYAYWETQQIDYAKHHVAGTTAMTREFETREAPSGRKYVVVNLSVAPSAAVKDKSEIYFRVPQFRIVGPPPEEGGRGPAPTAHLAAGMSDLYVHSLHNWPSIVEDQAKRLVRFNPTTDFILGPNQTRLIGEPKDSKAVIAAYRFDVAFEVPANFEPWYVSFKTGARAELTKKMFKPAPPPFASTALGNTGPGRTLAEADKPKVGKPQGGATHVANAVEEGTDVSSKLPFALPRSDDSVSRALKGGKLGECHFWVELPDSPPGGDEAVTEFFVPGEKRMVQIAAERNTALSMYGRALNYASNVAGQIKVSTADGRDFVAQGVYSAARIGGKMIVEIQYIDNADESDLRLKPAKKIKAADLRSAAPQDRKFGYLFIVDPGVKIVGFSSGGTGGTQPLNINVP